MGFYFHVREVPELKRTAKTEKPKTNAEQIAMKAVPHGEIFSDKDRKK